MCPASIVKNGDCNNSLCGGEKLFLFFPSYVKHSFANARLFISIFPGLLKREPQRL